MVATYNPSGDFNLDFTPIPDAMPPRAYDAEEQILGSILFDPGALYRVWHRLKPEHFGISGHKEIYKACYQLGRQNKPTDLISVASYLKDKGKLDTVGGRNKLVSLVQTTTTTANIDHHAAIVIEKSARYDLIRAGHEVIQLGYDTHLELEDIIESFKRKAESIVELETVKTEDELIKSKHDRLINKLKEIYTTTVEPSLKYLKLKHLADETRTSISFLENLYLKALVGICTQLMDYNDLKEAAGSSIRRWLQQGLIPVASTILLAADGGVGKTKFVYSLAKNLITGQDFGDFSSTGEKRRILFYQGDEQPGDMLQSLQMLGYEEGDINKYIRVRFGWSFDNMATLIKDLKEFNPDFVLFDSMSFGQRFSSCKEGDSEFARPILECTGLAVQHGCTFLFIHHTNKGGDIRGTTATRNAVSEVWRLKKDSRPEATQYDRILEIDKSRSRSSGKNYRLYFDPDNLSFNFLGEDFGEDDDKNTSTRDALLKYFRNNLNIKLTSEELCHTLSLSKNTCRRILNQLSSDGLVSVERKPGKAYLYFIESKKYDDSEGDRPDCMVTPPITQGDHLQDDYTASDTAKGDRVITKIAPQKNENLEKKVEQRRSPDHLSPNPAPVENPGGDRPGDHQVITRVIAPVTPVQEVVQIEQMALIPEPASPYTPPINLSKVGVKHNTCVGEIKAIAKQLDEKRWRFSFTPDIEGFVGDVVFDGKLGKSKPEAKLKSHIEEWLKSLNFQVYRATGNNGWVDNCKWVESFDHYDAMRKRHVFLAPDGTHIDVFGFGCDRIRLST